MMPLSSKRLSDRDYEISDQIALAHIPAVSVLLLAYNHGAYLSQSIDGVLAQQTDFAIEILIGEDCSTDDTREIALRYQRQYPDLIRVITAEENVGIRQNWQRLISSSRGEFLAQLDGDDYWLPGKLALQVEFLRQHPECAAVYTNAVTVDEAGRSVGLFNDAGDAQFDLAAMLRRGNFLNTSSMLFRTDLSHSLLELKELFIDYQVHLHLARSGFLRQFSQPLAVYRTNSIGSMTSESNDLVRELYWKAILDAPRHLVSDADFARGVADFLRRVISRMLRTQRWELIREWMPRVLKASPYGTVRTMQLVAASTARAVFLEARGRLRTGPDGRVVHVTHRR